MTGDYQEAIRDFKCVIQLDSTYTTSFTNLGLSYFKLDNYKESMHCLLDLFFKLYYNQKKSLRLITLQP